MPCVWIGLPAAWGLRSPTFRTQPYDGYESLLDIAATVLEIKTVCRLLPTFDDYARVDWKPRCSSSLSRFRPINMSLRKVSTHHAILSHHKHVGVHFWNQSCSFGCEKNHSPVPRGRLRRSSPSDQSSCGCPPKIMWMPDEE